MNDHVPNFGYAYDLITMTAVFARQENEPMSSLYMKYAAVRYYQAKEWNKEGKGRVYHAVVSASHA